MIWYSVLLLFFSQQCSSLFLNETEYDRMPPLFALDEYHKCLRKPDGTYCLAKLDLFSDEPSELMDMIRNYTAYTQRVRYNHTYIEHGVCVTKTCRNYIKDYDIKKNEDLERVIEACINQTIWDEYNLQARLSKIHYCDRHEQLRSEVSAADWAVLMLLITIILIVLFATLFHYKNIDNPELLQRHNYVLCFSFIKNWRFGMNESKDDRMNNLGGLHAIRWSGSVEMTLGHVIWTVSMGYMDNVRDHEEAYHRLHFSVLFNGMTVVQIFFVLSGFLLVYKLLIKSERTPLTWSQVLLMCFARVWRFLPSLLSVLLFSMTWLRHMGSGPLWQRHVGGVVRDCRKYWWTHLLFINNYVSDNKQCAIQTWHLAADVQIFLLVILVYVATRNHRQKLALGSLLVLSMLLPAMHVWWYDLDAHMLKTPEFLRSLDYDTFWRSYVLGHNNIGCFVIGMFSAIKLYEWQKSGVTFKDSKVARILYWISLPMLWVVFWTGTFFYEEGGRDPLLIRMLYQATHRLVFGFFVVVLIVGSVMKLDRFLTAAMRWRVWGYYAQLSYGVYLVHMNLVHLYSGTRTTLVHFSYYYMMVNELGIWTLSVLISLVLYMLVECPTNSLFNEVVKTMKASSSPKLSGSEKNVVFRPECSGESQDQHTTLEDEKKDK